MCSSHGSQVKIFFIFNVTYCDMEKILLSFHSSDGFYKAVCIIKPREDMSLPLMTAGFF